VKRLILICLASSMPTVALAQAIKPVPEMRRFSAEIVSAVEVPDIVFQQTPEDAALFDKYFFFHRAETSFDEAYADISECDALASGISFSAYGTGTVPYPYTGTMAGAIGGAIGGMMADAIFGSAERRRIRRINMRNCMGFKGYARYGMERERWQGFHFEEGFGRVEEEKRQGFLMKQAKVASGPIPQYKVLEP
jgi:hypothetical protein